MANKYHRQGFKVGKVVDILSKVYKVDKTGKKDEIIKSMNERLKKEKKKIEQEPSELESYTDLMVSDFETKTGPFFEKIRAREKAKQKAAELKKLKGKK
jgi:predicted RNA-binding protein with RPS1 domain